MRAGCGAGIGPARRPAADLDRRRAEPGQRHGAPLVAALWLFARRERAGARDPGRDGAATVADAPAERAA
ncbi:MAG TPA: hypothetical protein VFW96_03395 [Thermomicrobiales bacterium]|nr:hypothetical protein [Thermomicrobiales bacterium]